MAKKKKSFPVESLMELNRLNYLAEGFTAVEVVNVPEGVDPEQIDKIRKLKADGYRFFDENCYGIGFKRLGRVQIFVKGHAGDSKNV